MKCLIIVPNEKSTIQINTYNINNDVCVQCERYALNPHWITANHWINCMEISDRTRGEFNAILSECNYRRR